MPESAKLLTLPKWAARFYEDAPPSLNTLRSWARAGKIQPPPVKHGRAYRVHPDAVYSGGCDLLARIISDEQAEAGQKHAA